MYPQFTRFNAVVFRPEEGRAREASYISMCLYVYMNGVKVTNPTAPGILLRY